MPRDMFHGSMDEEPNVTKSVPPVEGRMKIKDQCEAVIALATELQRAVSMRQRVRAGGNLLTAMEALSDAIVKESIRKIVKMEKRG